LSAHYKRFVRVEYLLILIWVLVLIRLFRPGADGRLCAALSLARLRRRTLVLCGILAVMTIPLAAAYDGWGAIPLAADGATIFAALFGTIMILRATA